MQMILSLEFDDIKEILDKHYEIVKQDGGAPLCITAVNRAGVLIALYRMQNVHDRTIRIATNKAYTCVEREQSTKEFRESFKETGFEYAWLSDEKYCPIPGGIPVKVNSKIVGAIATSGRHMDEDHAVVAKIVAEIEAKLN